MDKCDRQRLFLLGCILTRLLLAALATYFTLTQSFLIKPLLFLTFSIGLGFVLIYFFRLRDTGFEAGGKIWWNNLRIFHGLLYLLFSFTALAGWKYCFIFLYIDVLFGLISYVQHYYKLCKNEIQQ